MIKSKKMNFRKTKTNIIGGGIFSSKNKYQIQPPPKKHNKKHSQQHGTQNPQYGPQKHQQYGPQRYQQHGTQKHQQHGTQRYSHQTYSSPSQMTQKFSSYPTVTKKSWWRTKKSQRSKDMRNLANQIIKHGIQYEVVKNMNPEQIKRMKRKELVNALIAQEKVKAFQRKTPSIHTASRI